MSQICGVNQSLAALTPVGETEEHQERAARQGLDT